MATSTQAVSATGSANGADDSKKSRKNVVRSPRSPAITFKDAVAKAKLIFKEENRSATTPLVIFQHLGFKKKTGPSGRMLAALQHYGLLERNGVGNYSITNKAFRLFNLPDEDPEHRKIERELAMRPALFKEIVAKYQKTGLPSDATLRSHLVLDRGFNSGSVDEFLKVFKASVEIAKPFDGAYTPPADSDEDGQEEEENLDTFDTPPEQLQARGSRGSATPPPPPPPPAKGQLPFPLYLSKDQKAMLYVPSVMTAREFELLKKQIENSFVVMEATLLSDESEQ